MADPTVPEITDEEAAVLLSFDTCPTALASCINKGLVSVTTDDECDGPARTFLGRAALAKHLAERERDVRKQQDDLWRRKWELAVDTIAERVGVIQRMEELLRRGVALERTHGPDAVALMATTIAWKDEVTKFLDSGKSLREVQP